MAMRPYDITMENQTVSIFFSWTTMAIRIVQTHKGSLFQNCPEIWSHQFVRQTYCNDALNTADDPITRLERCMNKYRAIRKLEIEIVRYLGVRLLPSVWNARRMTHDFRCID